MKWIALVLFIVIVPTLSGWLRGNPRQAPFVWGLLAFLPLVAGLMHSVIAPISWAGWPGYVKGAEIGLVDVVALAILLSRPYIPGTLPFVGLWAAYLVCALLSVVMGAQPEAALFVAWQICRVFVIACAAASICTDPRGPRVLLIGLSLGLAVNAVFSIQQKLSGVLQADGLYSHQNLLGMVSHFVAFPALAFFLADGRRKEMLIGVGAAAVVAILSASRGTIGLAGIGYVLLLGLSILRRPSGRKWAIVGAGVLVLAAAAPLALASLGERFSATPAQESDYDERGAFKQTARDILADHPMGIGANQYVVVANTQGYSDKNGVVAVSGSRSAHVHHAYLLIAAEMGYPGFIAFVLLLMWPILFALRTAWRYPSDPGGDVMLGYAVALIVVALQCLYEWVFVTYDVQVLFAITLGGITGLSRRMAWSHARAKRRPSARPMGAAEEARA